MNRTRLYSNPMRDFVNMANAMNRAMSYDYGQNGGSSNGNAESDSGRIARTAHLPINAWSEENTYMIKAYLPGVNPDDVEITFEKDNLTISGEFPSFDDEIDFIRNELFSGSFERRVSFNVPVEADKIEATFENGMLTLEIPKSEEAKPKRIAVKSA